MEEEEATLRLVMYFQDQKIEQYLLDTGGVPPGLRHQLPQGFSFDRERYQLDWENWILPEGMLSDSTVQGLIGISITTSDRSLSLALLDMIPMNAKFAFEETYTFIFATHQARGMLRHSDHIGRSGRLRRVCGGDQPEYLTQEPPGVPPIIRVERVPWNLTRLTPA